MDQSGVFVALACVAMLASCDRAGGDGNADQNAEAAVGREAPPQLSILTTSSIGQVQYGFSSSELTRAEIQLAVPPGFTRSVWAIKLIPAARAARLGRDECRYSSSLPAQTCTAEQEDGLAMALLEWPLGDYRRAFADAGIPDAQLAPVRLAGRQGFRFATDAEGARVLYGFLPLEDRTLLLVKRTSEGSKSSDPAIDDVIESLRFPRRPPQFSRAPDQTGR